MTAWSTIRRCGRLPGRLPGRLVCRVLCGVLCLAAFLANNAAGAGDAVPLGRLDFLPYRVVVSVTFAADPTVNPAFRQGVVFSLGSRIVQVFGATWTLLPADSVREDDRLTPPDEIGLGRLTFATAAEFVRGISCDKAYFLTVGLRGQTWAISGREWDQSLQFLGPVSRAETLDRRGIADAAVGLLQRIFTPLLTVDDADRNSQTATLTVRAGSIPFGDPQFAPLKKGSLLKPVFRFLTAKREVRQIVSPGWTYLVLDDLQGGRAKCRVVTSYRTPLAANMRRRVEAMAVLLHPELPETHLKLVTGRNVARPLGGLFVSMSSVDLDDSALKKPTPDKNAPVKHDAEKNNAEKSGTVKNDTVKNDAAKSTAQKNPAEKNPGEKNAPNKDTPAPVMLMSDRRGTVKISTDSRHPLRMLIVHSGTAILARRPFVPGVDAEVTLELPDDGLRLNTEREIDLLRGKLIETVAERAAYIGRTRAAFKKNEDATVKVLFRHLKDLPNAEKYANELNKIRVLAIEANASRKDRVSERRIDDLCQKTLQLIEQYLPNDRIQTLEEEMGVVLRNENPTTDMKPGTRRKVPSPAPQGAAVSKSSPPAVTLPPSSTGTTKKRFFTAPQKADSPDANPQKGGAGL